MNVNLEDWVICKYSKKSFIKIKLILRKKNNMTNYKWERKFSWIKEEQNIAQDDKFRYLISKFLNYDEKYIENKNKSLNDIYLELLRVIQVFYDKSGN